MGAARAIWRIGDFRDDAFQPDLAGVPKQCGARTRSRIRSDAGVRVQVGRLSKLASAALRVESGSRFEVSSVEMQQVKA